MLGQTSLPPYGFFYIKQNRHVKQVEYVYIFIIDKHFVMQYHHILDITPNKPERACVYTRTIRCSNVVNNSLMRSIYISMNNLV